MQAMLLDAQGQPLRLAEVPRPRAGPNQILLAVQACGVCRTDLHVMDGDLHEPRLPLILGHEIVGRVVEKGEQVERFALGQRVGVPWLGRPADIAATAPAAPRIFATPPSSPAIPWMAVTPSSRWPISATALPCRKSIPTPKPPPSSAPD